ncbi:uncharacterized protein RAG0_06697 [Rhynchosporium agropyri]|uniref:Uncharacterized protein n=1 Tax=Rhynchosporium agropyri TaxID=914238 RepID=A0A1E1KIG2_9HELO|nr:uncharacterized protein RAG0_06697 [Rhynchosporium agropyri]
MSKGKTGDESISLRFEVETGLGIGIPLSVILIGLRIFSTGRSDVSAAGITSNNRIALIDESVYIICGLYEIQGDTYSNI